MRLEQTDLGKIVYVRGWGAGIVREIEADDVSVELTKPNQSWDDFYSQQIGSVLRYPNDGNFVYLVTS